MSRAPLVFLLLFSAFSQASLDERFFANASFLERFPGATVLHERSFSFLENSLAPTFRDAEKLIEAIRQSPELIFGIEHFPVLARTKKIQLMQAIFRIQVSLTGVAAPELVLDDEAKRSTFFDFDPKKGGTGRVILNPKKLFSDSNPYAALLFLVHETRHSSQFQAKESAYEIGFRAQRQIFDEAIKVSFCDFLTLNQEYEAFLFGNIVMEVLTQGRVDTSDMGTLASQYVLGEGLKIDLPALAREVGPAALLDAFNEKEKAQYQAPAAGTGASNRKGFAPKSKGKAGWPSVR